MSEFEQRKLDMAAFHRGELSLDEVKARSERRRRAAGKSPSQWQRDVSAAAREARIAQAEQDKRTETK